MYDFHDKGDRHMALRPEATASVVRAFVQHRPPTPWKVWCLTPAFRYERPQAGRLRQHHQVDVEVLGAADPDVDVEVISLGATYLAALGLRRWRLLINTMGTPEDRTGYAATLTAWLRDRAGGPPGGRPRQGRDPPAAGPRLQAAGDAGGRGRSRPASPTCSTPGPGPTSSGSRPG